MKLLNPACRCHPHPTLEKRHAPRFFQRVSWTVVGASRIMELVNSGTSDHVRRTDAFQFAAGTPALLFVLFLLFVSGTAAGKSKISSHVLGRDYVEALAAANRFLHAWQSHDHEGGLLMLSDEAKRHVSEDRLEKFFSKPSNVVEAYEIGHAKTLKARRYTFPVTLFEVVDSRKVRPRYSQIVVTRTSTGEDDWAIDRLP